MPTEAIPYTPFDAAHATYPIDPLTRQLFMYGVTFSTDDAMAIDLGGALVDEIVCAAENINGTGSKGAPITWGYGAAAFSEWIKGFRYAPVFAPFEAQISQLCDGDSPNEATIIFATANDAPSGTWVLRTLNNPSEVWAMGANGSLQEAVMVPVGTVLEIVDGNNIVGSDVATITNLFGGSTFYITPDDDTAIEGDNELGCQNEEACPAGSLFDLIAEGFVGSYAAGNANGILGGSTLGGPHNGNFNAVIFGNLTNDGTGDTEGRLAVQGNFTSVNPDPVQLSTYSIGASNPLATGALHAPQGWDNLVVGGDVNHENPNVGMRGNILYNTATGLPGFSGGFSQVPGIYRNFTPDVNWAGALAYFQGFSANYNPANINSSCGSITLGTIDDSGDPILLDAQNSGGVVVFNLSGIGAGSSYDFRNTDNAEVILVNAGGTTLTKTGGSIFIDGITATKPYAGAEVTFIEKTCWNFYETTTINHGGFAWLGSFLAPLAASTSLSGGDINGQAVISGEVVQEGGFEFHNFCFNGNLSSCNACALNTPTIQATCNDAGTPNDPSDDTFTFTIVVTGQNTGQDFSIDFQGLYPNISDLAYNTVSVPLGPFPISGGDLTITITDEATGSCQLVDVVISAPTTCSACNQPTATLTPTAATCTAGTANNNGSISLTTASNATHYGISSAGAATYDGPLTIGMATAVPGTLPATILSNAPNAGASYIVRIFNGADDCFVDEVVTVAANVCVPSNVCECGDYIYLNEPRGGNGLVHKFRINSDGSFTEIPNGITNTLPWFPQGGGLPSPHGLGQDLNGNLYIGETETGPIRKLTCEGELLPVSEFAPTPTLSPMLSGIGGFNVVSYNGVLYVNNIGSDRISAYDICTGMELGYVRLAGIPDNNGSYFFPSLQDWGFHIDENGVFYATVGFFDSPIGLRGIYRFVPTEADFTAHTTYSVTVPSSTFPAIITNYNVWGITSDESGNMFVIIEDGGNNRTWILKYDAAGNFLASTFEVVSGDNVGFEGARGLTYLSRTNKIYVAAGIFGDCVAIIDPITLAYEGSAVGNVPGQDPKGISIVKECCPPSGISTIEESICYDGTTGRYFLQDLINCDGPVCQGGWEELMSNPAITYNDCDASVTITGTGCAVFRLQQTSGNSVCPTFTILINLCSVTPDVTLSDPADVCIDGADMNFTAAPAGGVFTTTATMGFTPNNAAGTATLDVSAAGAGTYDVTYIYTDADGCEASQTVSVEVFGVPTVTLDDPADVCIDGADMNFTATPTGGVFTTTATAGFTPNNAAGTATLDVSAAGAGTYDVTYTYTDANGCDAFQTVSVTVNPLPILTCPADRTVCLTAAPVVLDALPAGGTYAGAGVAGNTFTAATAGVGTSTITYTFTDGNGCENACTFNINVLKVDCGTFPWTGTGN
ncbi:choice-of-anchor A family protein [Neolewinella lacunae]|uniref:Choice-of-anchor A family protein n=1 Tax=Neolewinella lacunae TaxID=1517758 RepID=A0A923TBZ0_9BACT|nr:choice-of-anchor A family protein [Neolewinella lacunae]MBC6993147.1 choice-of-anchor A family protein [Neolewinella lacunae]MDN3633119.1 choice-of-anchor A family protein [Neolewinella lacunae]